MVDKVAHWSILLRISILPCESSFRHCPVPIDYQPYISYWYSNA